MLQKRHNGVIFVFLVSNVSLVWTTLCYCTSREDVIPVFLETKTSQKRSTNFLKNKCFIGQIKGDHFCPEDQPFCLSLESIRQAPCSEELHPASYSWQLSSYYTMEQIKQNSVDDKAEQRRFLIQDDPSWNEWGSWQDCIAVSCETNGIRSRERQCLPKSTTGNCVGEYIEFSTCMKICSQHNDSEGTDWSEWSAWSTCTVPCNSNDTSFRTRACHAAENAYCIGYSKDEKPCPVCTVDGGWSDWSAWFGCSATCEDGTDHRYRACNNPLPKNGGIYCHGPFSESTSCNLGHCPVDGYWSDWGPWGTCSVTCSNGTSTRNRTCSNPAPAYGGKNCIGINTDTQNCIQAACKIDGGWANWSPWFGCSVTCEQGIDHRYRACTNPTPQHGGKYCQGSFSETSQCDLGSCPVDGNWAEWGSWGTCSVTCSNGTSVRNRTCDNPSPESGGKPCPGHSFDVMDCLENPCPIDGNWSEWGPWGRCSVTCSNGTSERTRKCTNPKPEFGGKACSGDSRDMHDCFIRTCVVDGNWAEWGSWGTCSVTCSNGTSVRNRTCDNPSPESGGKPCPGHSFDVMDCLENPCPIDGNWGHWTPWSRCFGGCDTANKQRYRNCDKPLPENGGNICEGSPFEMTSCVPQSCATTVQG